MALSAKSAVRLQVVCKRWYSLKSSPYFIARFNHLRHHRHVESSLVFKITYDCYGTYSDFKTISNSSLLLSHLNLNYLPKDIQLECSFHDLILCSSFSNYNYYVSNLLTRQTIVLPEPPASDGLIQIGFLYDPPPCSDCNPPDNTSHHKFMVVRLITNHSLIPHSRFDVQVFSSDDGQWRNLVVSSPLPLKGSGHHVSLVAYRGMLHWLNYDCIAVYDPLNTPKTFSRIIHLPTQPTDFLAYSCFGLCACQGHLRVVKHYGGNKNLVVDVWELEDYDSGSWNLVHKVYLNNLVYDNSLPIVEKGWLSRYRVLSHHPDNGDVIYIHVDNGIALVNMKTRIVKCYYSEKKNAPIYNSVAFHLVDKWWPTPVPSLLH